MTDALHMLVAMTQELGQPHHDYVMIGEGNTSYRVDDDTFWIKASGQGMAGIGADGFVAVRLAPILGLLDTPDIAADAMKAATKAAKVDPDAPLVPSIEVTFHAALLADCGVRCVAHTHPTAINGIMCSPRAEEFATRRMFPDQIVLCGPTSVLVPYTDPGLPLALAIRERVRAYIDENGESPKTILLVNHGLIALGQTPTEALNITAMCVKAAHIFTNACSLGGPVFLSSADVAHIYRRPDEIYRQRRFAGVDG